MTRKRITKHYNRALQYFFFSKRTIKHLKISGLEEANVLVKNINLICTALELQEERNDQTVPISY